MTEKITLRVFLICLLCCATLVLFLVWTGGPDKQDPAILFKIVATFFVTGLASFLIWLVAFLYRLRERLP